MSEDEWREFAAIIETALAKRPTAMRRQLGMFLRILDVMSLARTAHTLAGLDLQQRTRFLQSVENSRLLLFRRGFWGVRTLVFMGYYARSACAGSLGYAAAARGWELRR